MPGSFRFLSADSSFAPPLRPLHLTYNRMPGHPNLSLPPSAMLGIGDSESRVLIIYTGGKSTSEIFSTCFMTLFPDHRHHWDARQRTRKLCPRALFPHSNPPCSSTLPRPRRRLALLQLWHSSKLPPMDRYRLDTQVRVCHPVGCVWSWRWATAGFDGTLVEADYEPECRGRRGCEEG